MSYRPLRRLWASCLRDSSSSRKIACAPSLRGSCAGTVRRPIGQRRVLVVAPDRRIVHEDRMEPASKTLPNPVRPVQIPGVHVVRVDDDDFVPSGRRRIQFVGFLRLTPRRFPARSPPPHYRTDPGSCPVRPCRPIEKSSIRGAASASSARNGESHRSCDTARPLNRRGTRCRFRKSRCPGRSPCQ